MLDTVGLAKTVSTSVYVRHHFTSLLSKERNSLQLTKTLAHQISIWITCLTGSDLLLDRGLTEVSTDQFSFILVNPPPPLTQPFWTSVTCLAWQWVIRLAQITSPYLWGGWLRSNCRPIENLTSFSRASKATWLKLKWINQRNIQGLYHGSYTSVHCCISFPPRHIYFSCDYLSEGNSSNFS